MSNHQWKVGGKTYARINQKDAPARVADVKIKDGEQFCLLDVAVSTLSGKVLVVRQPRAVKASLLRQRYTIVSELGEKEDWQA